MNSQEHEPSTGQTADGVTAGPKGATKRPILVWFLTILTLLYAGGMTADTIMTEGVTRDPAFWYRVGFRIAVLLLGMGVFFGLRWALLFLRGVWGSWCILLVFFAVLLFSDDIGLIEFLNWRFTLFVLTPVGLTLVWAGSVTAFCKKTVWKEGVRVDEDEREEYPARPVPMVLIGCLVSLFLPGAGHLILGYTQLGGLLLASAAAAFALGLLFGGVLDLAPQVAALPLFFVWLFAVQDLWAKGTRKSESADQRQVVRGYAEKKVAELRHLAEVPDRGQLQAMENALLDDDAHVSEAAGEALAALGPPAVDVLVPHLGSTQWGLRKRAIAALIKIGDEKALEALAQHRKVEKNFELMEMMFGLEDPK